MQPSHIKELLSQDHGEPTPAAESPMPTPEAPGGPADGAAIAHDAEAGVNPQNVRSMSRGEDDAVSQGTSPEFHDRPGQGNKVSPGLDRATPAQKVRRRP